jgi:hypothetical protein
MKVHARLRVRSHGQGGRYPGWPSALGSSWLSPGQLEMLGWADIGSLGGVMLAPVA